MPEIGKVDKISDDGFDVQWKIPNFFSVLRENDCYLSPIFSCKGESWSFYFYINPKRDIKKDSIGYIDLNLVREESSGPPLVIEFYISFKSVSGKKIRERYFSKFFIKKDSEHDLLHLISIPELLSRKAELLPSGVLTIVCASKSALKTSDGNDILVSSEAHPKDKILQNFEQLFHKQGNCDVVFRIQGQDFLAHKAILMDRSPVFALKFKDDRKKRRKETETSIVNVKDFDPSVFLDFLHFLYIDDMDCISIGNSFGLFIAAHKYDIPELKEKCVEIMKENLSVDTLCKTVHLALRHTLTELLQLTTNFFIKNAEEILETSKWQTFIVENPIHGNDLFIQYVKSTKHSNI